MFKLTVVRHQTRTQNQNQNQTQIQDRPVFCMILMDQRHFQSIFDDLMFLWSDSDSSHHLVMSLRFACVDFLTVGGAVLDPNADQVPDPEPDQEPDAVAQYRLYRHDQFDLVSGDHDCLCWTDRSSSQLEQPYMFLHERLFEYIKTFPLDQ